MPTRFLENHVFEQDWDDVVWKKKRAAVPTTVPSVTIGRKIVLLRQKKQITLLKLSNLLHITKKELGEYEAGKLVPCKRIVSKLSKIFNTNMHVFLN